MKPSSEQIKLLVENHKKFQKFLAKRLPNEAVAEDILQQSLKKALEQPPDATADKSVLAWFYTVLKNSLADYYRKNATETRGMKSLAAESERSTPAADDLKAGVCQCMKGLLPTLKTEYAELLSRIDLGEESPESVARDLKITRTNLDVRLHRAREALKKSLVNTCGTCTKHGCLNCTCS